MNEFNNTGVLHHFATGVYAKEQTLSAGSFVMTHKHTYDHLSILAKGACKVITDRGETNYVAPACVLIARGVNHRIEATEDAVWFCIHHTFETDPQKVDNVIIARA